MPSYRLCLPSFTLPFPSPHENDGRQFAREQREVNDQPLEDRQAARDDYYRLLTMPDRFGDELGHILAGNYGLYPLHQVVNAATNNRMNYRAVVGMFIAHYHGCTATFARQAYNRLTIEQKQTIDSLIDRVITEVATEWSQQP